jgi:hypothetical protein
MSGFTSKFLLQLFVAYGFLYRGIVLRFLTNARDFYFLQSVQIFCGSYPASCSVGAGGHYTWP